MAGKAGNTATDSHYMEIAAALARNGVGFVNPNPMVGAVIVKDGRIIGQGWHEKYGGPHAERNAIANCTASPSGATLYVTLEPCCHYGKTPPCTEAVLESGIKRVVVAGRDPNPVVAGKGIEMLRGQGVEVLEGVLMEECRKLNEVFFHYITTKTPFVVMKYAMTMDGKIAAYTGKSKWITGETARQQVHRDRHRYMAIMVGVGTVLADDPLLTCRLGEESCISPIRIICDTHLRTPLRAQIVQTAQEIPTILVTSSSDEERIRQFAETGCRIIHSPLKNRQVDLSRLMAVLGEEEKIDSILLEGGGTLNWSALHGGIVNKVQTYISPKILGGAGAKTPVSGIGVMCPGDAFLLANSSITRLGEDILVESEVVRRCLQE